MRPLSTDGAILIWVFSFPLFRTVVLFLVMDPEWNVYDQRVMEYATEEISQQGYEYQEGIRVLSPCRVIRRSLEQLHGITLKKNKSLIV